MTAEIAVLNEEAIALAADSAVTGPAKIFTSANKIFALSKYHPVALMVYDNARFHGVPWETIVKQYRRELKKKSFPTLEAHAAHFLKWFDGSKKLFPPEAQKLGTAVLIYSLYEWILEDAFSDVRHLIEVDGKKPTLKEVVKIIEGSIAWHHDRWKGAPARKGLPKGYREKVQRRYGKIADEALVATYEKVPLSPKARRQLKQLLPWVATKNLPFERLPTHSGIVVAGFGSGDVFPRLRRFAFEGVIAEKLKCFEGPPIDIGPGGHGGAAIVPFAQREQVDTFMAGIDKSLRNHLHNWWHRRIEQLVEEIGTHLKLSKKRLAALQEEIRDHCIEVVGKDYEDALDQYSRENNVDPIIDIVGMLPKDELAEMAEALVNLTSFKRRVTPEAETVGGPIDVAVISRGDGFIWIKRKHYFTTELNPHFLANYYQD